MRVLQGSVRCSRLIYFFCLRFPPAGAVVHIDVGPETMAFHDALAKIVRACASVLRCLRSLLRPFPCGDLIILSRCPGNRWSEPMISAL